LAKERGIIDHEAKLILLAQAEQQRLLTQVDQQRVETQDKLQAVQAEITKSKDEIASIADEYERETSEHAVCDSTAQC
jgi:septal ring factor EnvC (AmiA/AmiB activator)